jgi:hypothetical protein
MQSKPILTKYIARIRKQKCSLLLGCKEDFPNLIVFLKLEIIVFKTSFTASFRIINH